MMTPYSELPERIFRAGAVGAADDVAARAVADEHAALAVGKRVGAAGIGADVIAEHDIAGRVRVGDEDAVLRIAGDNIPRQRVGAADECFRSRRLAMRIP